MKRGILFISMVLLMRTCAPAATVPSPTASATSVPPTATETILPTETATVQFTPTETFTPTITSTPTPDTRPLPRNWASWPIVPSASAKMIRLYQEGQVNGVAAHSYSVVGDCQSEPDVFMGIYGTDRNPINTDQPELLDTIGVFKDSFNHKSASVRDGLSAPSALDPLWADPAQCESNESPVACELRLSNPTIVFVNLGTNWRAGASADAYEGYLRKIVELVLANNSIPILTNKADNVEGDHSLNLATAKVAYDYDIPLINFWLAADSLPNHGLDSNRDNIYLTPAAWDVRNYVALRTLDSIWRSLQTATP